MEPSSRPKSIPPKLDTLRAKLKWSPSEESSAIPESGGTPESAFLEESGGYRSFSAPASPKLSLKRFQSGSSRGRQNTGLSFADFRKHDIRPRKQRLILEALEQERQTIVMQDTGKEANLRLSTSKDRSRSATSPLLSPSGGLSMKLTRISILKGITRKKKKSPAENYHLLTLAIRDKHPTRACLYLEDLGNKYFKVKRKTDSDFLLLHAMANRMEDVCIAMMDRGFPMDINAPIIMDIDSKHHYPSFFMLSVVFGLDRVIKTIIKKAKVNLSWYGLTPLMIACMRGDASMVQYLIDKGADVNLGIPTKAYQLLRKLKYSQCTPQSSSTYVPPDVRKQWSYNTKPTESSLPEEFSKAKVYPIDIALMGEHFEVADQLVTIMEKKGAKRSHLLYFLVKDVERAFRYMSMACPSADQRDARNASPLHIAARSGNLEMVIFLISNGCPVDLRGENGWTALHEAISEHHIVIARYLISQGASFKELTHYNDTPEMLALKCGYNDKDIQKCFAPIQPGSEEYLNAELTVKNMSKLYPVKETSLGSNASIDEKSGKVTARKRLGGISSFLSSNRLSQG